MILLFCVVFKGNIVRLDEKIDQQKSFLNDLSREYALNPLPSEKERSYFFEVLEKAKKTITGKITFDFDFVSQLKKLHGIIANAEAKPSASLCERRWSECTTFSTSYLLSWQK